MKKYSGETHATPLYQPFASARKLEPSGSRDPSGVPAAWPPGSWGCPVSREFITSLWRFQGSQIQEHYGKIQTREDSGKGARGEGSNKGRVKPSLYSRDQALVVSSP